MHYHNKNDITSALLRLMENVEAKLSSLESQVAEIQRKLEKVKK
jgi:hypothetical protein